MVLGQLPSSKSTTKAMEARESNTHTTALAGRSSPRSRVGFLQRAVVFAFSLVDSDLSVEVHVRGLSRLAMVLGLDARTERTVPR